jgi:hypothetical protein
MRYDPLIQGAFPSRHVGGELEPSSTQLEMIREGSPSEVVHPMCDALDD